MRPFRLPETKSEKGLILYRLFNKVEHTERPVKSRDNMKKRRSQGNFRFFSLCGPFFFFFFLWLQKKILPNRIQSLATRHRTRWTKFFFFFSFMRFDVRKPQSPSGLQIRRRVSFRAKPVQKWTVKNPSSCVACVFFLPSSHNTQPMISSHKLACPCLLCVCFALNSANFQCVLLFRNIRLLKYSLQIKKI